MVISELISQPGLIQTVTDSSIIQQYDLPTIFATYRLFKKQPNEYICESLRQLVGKYLSEGLYKIQITEPEMIVEYGTTQTNEITVSTNIDMR